jgi:hypothetical protein
MVSKTHALIPVLLAGIAIAAACGAGCLAPESPEDPDPAPEFHQVTESYNDRIVFSIIPYRDTPATYVADFEILRNGTTVEARSNVVYENVSESDPIIFEVARSANESVSLEVEVRNTSGDVLHTSTTTITPA